MILKRAAFFPFLLLPFLLAACNAPQTSQISAWAQAVRATHDQSDASFAAVNTLVRKQQIRYVATQSKLDPNDFTPGLPADALAAWDTALNALATYGDNVATVADPNTYAGTGQSAANLAQEVAGYAHSTAFQTQPGLAAAISKIGDAIASAAGGAEARDIMRKANPAVQDLLSHMSDMIATTASDGTETGVIATVRSNWNTRLAELQTSFLAPGADKMEVATYYADVASHRDHAIALLRSLQDSLRLLANIHGQLATGQPSDVATLLAQIQQQTKLAAATSP